jgi:hypothetical protein
MAAITITTAGHNMFRDALKGLAVVKITYVALGTSNTAPNVNDTKLGAEVFRKSVTTYSNGANIGEILINMYLSQSELIGTTIQEIGFFGNNATALANSGTLLARGLYSHTHIANPPESIVFQLDYTA